MLRVSIKCRNQIIELPSLEPGGRPGQLTDYSHPGNTILVFLCEKNNRRSLLLESKKGGQIDFDEYSFLMSEKMDKIKEIKPGETYLYEFKNRMGDWCELILTHV